MNILNEAYGQDPKDTIGITKYFELPASAQERSERDSSETRHMRGQLALTVSRYLSGAREIHFSAIDLLSPGPQVDGRVGESSVQVRKR